MVGTAAGAGIGGIAGRPSPALIRGGVGLMTQYLADQLIRGGYPLFLPTSGAVK